MQAIVIGAGRGQRLMPLTREQPKCFAPVAGRRILDWILAALAGSGFTSEHIAFVGGYRLDQIRSAYPDFIYYENTDWRNNNILASLFFAESEMTGGFVCSYSDILYRRNTMQKLMESQNDITLLVDIDWRSRYLHRSLHPVSDAEKVVALDNRITQISRHIPADAASGEFIGVAKFSEHGATLLREHYHRAREKYQSDAFQGAPSFQSAYLIHLFQEMIEEGIEIHQVEIAGDYYEIDTTEDYQMVLEEWR